MSFDEFLKEVAPRLGLQWRPFQRRGVKRKVERRIIELGFSRFDEYLLRVQKDPEEKSRLSKILTVTISRFFRDKEVFDTLETSVLPAVLKNREKKELNVWSIGCASGEEPYSVSLLWKEKFKKDFPGVRLSILATDIDEKMLRRAEEGRYKKSSLRETPQEVLENFFKKEDGILILYPSVKKSVGFKRHDILREEPFPGMDIIFCRNLTFTYFSKESQMKVLKKIFSSLKEKGYLVIGRDESLPLTFPTLFIPIFPTQKIYRKFNPNR
ncbi:MAG: protein-glutamate O-methyltransferase CheR [Deltaproteobacteria bacterium]|nr:protein-glutamate O-methyltransferase CheR [Deltaproteobacteria bacterium]